MSNATVSGNIPPLPEDDLYACSASVSVTIPLKLSAGGGSHYLVAWPGISEGKDRSISWLQLLQVAARENRTNTVRVSPITPVMHRWFDSIGS